MNNHTNLTDAYQEYSFRYLIENSKAVVLNNQQTQRYTSISFGTFTTLRFHDHMTDQSEKQFPHSKAKGRTFPTFTIFPVH
jgi:hypothetical protein